MARIARIVLPKKAHLVCQNSGKAIFNTPRRKAAYLEILFAGAQAQGMKLLAWSVLDGEAHLVVAPPTAQAFSSFMRVVQARYARFLHANSYHGPVAAQRFASCPLDDEAALDAIKYVEHLPVARGAAGKPEAYAYSSAAVRLGRTAGPLADEPAITAPIRQPERWLKEPLPPQRSAHLAVRLRTGKPVGDERFIHGLERKLGINLSRGPGRPKRSAG